MGKESHIKKKKNTNAFPVGEQHYGAHNANVFVESIGELCADDFAPPPPPPPIWKRLKVLIRPLVLVALLGVFVASGWTLAVEISQYKRADEIYDDLADKMFTEDLSLYADMSSVRIIMPSAPPRKMEPMPDYHSGLTQVESGPIELPAVYNEKFEKVRSNLAYLRTINPDIYGFINIEGTNICYPIVKGDDNDFYLDHAYTREFLVPGSIFADCTADDNFENNRNTVFYGHNIMNGSMFNNVMLFQDEEVFNTKLIEIYTFDGIYTFEPFSIFQTVYTNPYNRMHFSSDEDFVSFCERMQASSLHNKEMAFTGQDKIITLSTCTPADDVASYYVGRFALHAKLVKVEK